MNGVTYPAAVMAFETEYSIFVFQTKVERDNWTSGFADVEDAFDICKCTVKKVRGRIQMECDDKGVCDQHCVKNVIRGKHLAHSCMVQLAEGR